MGLGESRRELGIYICKVEKMAAKIDQWGARPGEGAALDSKSWMSGLWARLCVPLLVPENTRQ